MRIFQVLPVLAFGDAIGNHTISLKQVIEELGYATGIYGEIIDGRLPKGTGFSLNEMPALREDDVVIYHLSTGSALNRSFGEWKCRKIIEYHNITPPFFFQGYNLSAKRSCEDGYMDTEYLADKADYCLADSEYNKCELQRMGFRQKIDVMPILVPFQDYEKKPSQKVLERYEDENINILFTGRIAPNKKQEDVIKAFYYYKKYMNSGARLFLVGSHEGMERYYNSLQNYVDVLELEDVYFLGHIRFDEILAYYKLADVFVCMSEHEGFCVPLLEAMKFEIPIVAYESSAIPGTLGGSGIVLQEKDPKLTAELINRLVEDKTLHSQVVACQNERLEDFDYNYIRALFARYLKDFLGDVK